MLRWQCFLQFQKVTCLIQYQKPFNPDTTKEWMPLLLDKISTTFNYKKRKKKKEHWALVFQICYFEEHTWHGYSIHNFFGIFKQLLWGCTHNLNFSSSTWKTKLSQIKMLHLISNSRNLHFYYLRQTGYTNNYQCVLNILHI